MKNNNFNENFGFFDEDSNSYSYDNIYYNLVNNYDIFPLLNTVDLIQNETQYTNRIYYKSNENQPLLLKNNKEKDDNVLDKPKEKIIIFKTELIKEKIF